MAITNALMKIGEQALSDFGGQAIADTATSTLSSLLPSVAADVATKTTLGGIVSKVATDTASDGMMTLYRGLEQKYDPKYPVAKLDTSGYESWTDNPELARQYGDYVYSIDVPKSDIKTSYLDEDPMSPTYGDRNPIYEIDKKAGLNGVSGKEYLLEVGSDYQKGLKYNPVDDELNMAIRASGVDNGVATRAESFLNPANTTNFNEDTLNLIETLRGVGANVDDNGLVSLYHRTTPENAREIYKTGKMFGKENDGGLFFSTSKDYQPDYGSAVVEAKIPANKIQLDDVFDNNADVKYVVGRPNQMEDMSEYLVPQQEVPDDILNKVEKYFKPADKLGNNMKSVAEAMRSYKDKNVMNMANNMIDEYGKENFDWAGIRRKGEKVIKEMMGDEGLNNLKTFIEPVVNNASKMGEYEINKTVATNFLKSKDSNAIVKASRELLPPGTKIYRRGDKSGISWTTNEALARSSRYDGELLEHTLTKNDRYIAPEFIDILQRTPENEYQVLFKLGE